MKKYFILIALLGCSSNSKFTPDAEKSFDYKNMNVKNCIRQAKKLFKINQHIIPDLRDYILSRITDYEILMQKYPRPTDFFKDYRKKSPFPQDVLYQYEGGWQGVIDGITQREVYLTMQWDSQMYMYEENGSLLPGVNYIDHLGRICRLKKKPNGKFLIYEGRYIPAKDKTPGYILWVGKNETFFTVKDRSSKYRMFKVNRDKSSKEDFSGVYSFRHWKM